MEFTVRIHNLLVDTNVIQEFLVRYIFMFQFCIAITRTSIVAAGIVECGYPWQNCLGTLIFIEAPFLILFLDFYLKSYSKKPSKTKSMDSNKQSNRLTANGEAKKTE